jgi:hypothetical protein
MFLISRENKENILKKTSDFLEKMSVGSLVVGLYQDNTKGVITGVILLLISLPLVFRSHH